MQVVLVGVAQHQHVAGRVHLDGELRLEVAVVDSGQVLHLHLAGHQGRGLLGLVQLVAVHVHAPATALREAPAADVTAIRLGSCKEGMSALHTRITAHHAQLEG